MRRLRRFWPGAAKSAAFRPRATALHSYHEHALTRGSSSKAVSYIEITAGDGSSYWGAAVHSDIIVASIKALLSAINRSRAAEAGEGA